jgi:hypothetical protein
MKSPCGKMMLPTVLAVAVAGGGCGTDDPYQVGPTVPVAGKVMLVGKPLRLNPGEFARLWFCPDKAKGNLSPHVPVGNIGPKGNYRLSTRGKDGAPTGWYNVMIVANGPVEKGKPSKGRKALLPLSYSDPKTSGLVVFVAGDAPPGAYDLKLTGKRP